MHLSGYHVRMIPSLPSRGAWIEMVCGCVFIAKECLSLPSRGAWIEITIPCSRTLERWKSLPSRGAWIEIATSAASVGLTSVAPLAGSVDRNKQQGLTLSLQQAVAPLAGSVDRNI